MYTFLLKSLLIVFSSLVISGCTPIKNGSDAYVFAIIGERINKGVNWNRDSCDRESIVRIVNTLLEQELTHDSAVQIALLNNPELQAIFEEIGIAHADLVQAGLLQNPILAGTVRFPEQKHASVNTEFSITQNFLDLLLIPLRKKIATAEFEKVQLKVANAVLRLSFDVQELFYRLQADCIKVELMQTFVEVTEAAYALAEGQRHAGNINDMEYQTRLNAYLEAKAELGKSQVEVICLRVKLNRFLGLSSTELCWQINKNLPTLPQDELPLDCLEEIAMSQRLDLEMARWEVERIARMFGITHWWAYTDAILGVSNERDAEGINVTGPIFSLELPIFNYGQADRERLRAMFRQSVEKLKSLEIEVSSEVRCAREQVFVQRKMALLYLEKILPLQKQIVSTSQGFYHVMALNVYKMMGAKQQEVQMQIKYNSTLRDYWIARVKLDQALGGNLFNALARFKPCTLVSEETGP